MFKNIGKNLKNIAKILCIIGMVISVIYGISIAFLIVGAGSESTNIFKIIAALVLGIVLAAILCFLCWLGYATLYGFGKLIENSDKMLQNSERILMLAQKNNSQEENQYVTPESNLTWTCSKCGYSVSKDYTYCPFCDYVNKCDRKGEF